MFISNRPPGDADAVGPPGAALGQTTSARGCPNMRTPHGLLPVALAKVTGHAHSSWFAETCMDMLAWHSRTCLPSAYKLLPRLVAL